MLEYRIREDTAEIDLPYITNSSFTGSKWEIFQLLSAIAYLQSENLIHGDLKEDNILISTDGTLYLIDFGFTQRVDELTTVEGLRMNRYYKENNDVWATAVMWLKQLLGITDVSFGYASIEELYGYDEDEQEIIPYDEIVMLRSQEVPEPERSILRRMLRGTKTAMEILQDPYFAEFIFVPRTLHSRLMVDNKKSILPTLERRLAVTTLLGFYSGTPVIHRTITLFDLCCTYEDLCQNPMLLLIVCYRLIVSFLNPMTGSVGLDYLLPKYNFSNEEFLELTMDVLDRVNYNVNVWSIYAPNIIPTSNNTWLTQILA